MPNYTNRHQIKKHHWFLGSLVIVIGSWITHSTTATISDVIIHDTNISQQTSVSVQPIMQNSLTQLINVTANDAMLSTPDQFTPLSFAIAPVEIVQPIVETLTSTTHTVKNGDTLGVIFKKLDLNLSLPYIISQHDIAKQLVSLSIGKQITFKSNELGELREIIYPVNDLQQLLVNIKEGSVDNAEIVNLAYETKQHEASVQITSSLYEAAIEAGLSNNIIMELVKIFGWDIDFVQDIRAGDNFHVIYTDYSLNGKKLADGNILAAEFVTQNQKFRAIRFTDSQENASYYTPDGNSMLGTFLRSPVEFSRISSRFGKRKHPILKTWRAHKGVDYAAARGTPIRATADGKVTLAGKKGGYGRTVILAHAGRFSTLYAHMNGFAKGLRRGKKVKQGDIIGYIGSTGLATGPHLHYEFRMDGVHRNPLTYKTPKASSIAARSQAEFFELAASLGSKLETAAKSFQLAKSDQAAMESSTQL